MSIKPERSPRALRALARGQRKGSRPPRVAKGTVEAVPEVLVEEPEPEVVAPVKKKAKKKAKKTTKKKAKKKASKK